MIEELRKYQKKHFDEMEKAMDDCQSRFMKCDSIFTAALFYSDEPIDQDGMKKKIRASDHFCTLRKNLIMFIFEETPIEGGITASEKLLSIFLQEKNQTIYVAAAEGEKGKEMRNLVFQLFRILEFAIEHQHRNEVLDSNYLDGVY